MKPPRSPAALLRFRPLRILPRLNDVSITCRVSPSRAGSTTRTQLPPTGSTHCRISPISPIRASTRPRSPTRPSAGNSDHEMTAYYELFVLRKKWMSMPWGSYGATQFVDAMAMEYSALSDLQARMMAEDAARSEAAFAAARQHLQAINDTYSFPISIIIQPESQTIAHNQTATFTVVIAGKVSLCNWYERSYDSSPDDYSYFHTGPIVRQHYIHDAATPGRWLLLCGGIRCRRHFGPEHDCECDRRSQNHPAIFLE